MRRNEYLWSKRLTRDKSIELAELHEVADNKIKHGSILGLVERVENFSDIRENADNQHFLLFPNVSEILPPLTHYQTTNLRLFQTERVCRRQFQN